jgi:ankyrin repeat protein
VVYPSVDFYLNRGGMSYPGWLPIHIAVQKLNIEAIKILLKYGADINKKKLSVFEFDDDLTPLMLAAYMHNSYMIDFLIESGVK